MLTQYCATCGLLKPISGFHRDSQSAYGHKETCKECRNAQGRQRRADATPEEKAAEATRSRRRRMSSRSLNWERVNHLVIEAVLWSPSPQAQDIGKEVEAMLAGAAGKPLPRGGAPAAWDTIIDIRSVIKRTEGAELVVEVALASERLDVIKTVLIPQAEAGVAWCDRQHSPRLMRADSKRALNAVHAEQRVLDKRIGSLRQRAAYTRAMEHLAHRLYAMGVR